MLCMNNSAIISLLIEKNISVNVKVTFKVTCTYEVSVKLQFLVSTLQQAIECVTKIAILQYYNEVLVLCCLSSLIVILT